MELQYMKKYQTELSFSPTLYLVLHFSCEFSYLRFVYFI